MSARQSELFEKPKRHMRGRLMHVCDAGYHFEDLIVEMQCAKCSYRSDWIKVDTVTDAKRGLPCPKCNEAAA